MTEWSWAALAVLGYVLGAWGITLMARWGMNEPDSGAALLVGVLWPVAFIPLVLIATLDWSTSKLAERWRNGR